MERVLVVICGPTAVGKTNTSIELAKRLSAEIISADSRQFYKELKIGTAAPTTYELGEAQHHFVGHISIFDYYNASIFEQQVVPLLDKLFQKNRFVIMTGGSGLYIDAVCEGIDDMPDIDPHTRESVKSYYQKEGLGGLRRWLQSIDPVYYAQVDIANPKRMMRGIEVFLSSGTKFSDFRIKDKVERPFGIKKIILSRQRHDLCDRINQRTDAMIQQGLIEEAKALYPLKHLNALNTVGYKELFAYFENTSTLDEAIEKIKTNTRRYAKRQMTWFRRYTYAKYFDPNELELIVKHIIS